MISTRIRCRTTLIIFIAELSSSVNSGPASTIRPRNSYWPTDSGTYENGTRWI